MRRSICFTEPSTVLAGERSTWKFAYTPATSLPKGTMIRFDLASKGRSIDWEIPSASPKAKANSIYAVLPNGKVVFAHEVKVPNSVVPQYEFTLPSDSGPRLSPIGLSRPAADGSLFR